MNKYRFVYWKVNKCIAYVEAHDVEEAKYLFYMNYHCDDIISITLVE